VTNDGALARQAASELTKIPPDILISSNLAPSVDLLLSRLYLLLNDVKKSRGVLARCVHRSPWDAKSWARLSRLGGGDGVAAGRNGVVVSGIRGGSGEVYVGMGVALIKGGGELKAAKGWMSKGVRADPGDLNAWFGLAMVVRAEISTGQVGKMDLLKKMLRFVIVTSVVQMAEARRVVDLVVLRT
jgi:hypothetical protein